MLYTSYKQVLMKRSKRTKHQTRTAFQSNLIESHPNTRSLKIEDRHYKEGEFKVKEYKVEDKLLSPSATL